MSSSVNKIMLLGNLGGDPEMRYTKGGNPVCNMRVATNSKWKDSKGEWVERTEWHRIVVWGSSAENCNTYLKKGRTVHIEGRMQYREWEDDNSTKRITAEVVADRVTFVSTDESRKGTGQHKKKNEWKNNSRRDQGGDDMPPF